MENIWPAFLLVLYLCGSPVLAASPKIEAAQGRETQGGWTFAVTLSHPDTGWDHYADGWRVVDSDGNVLGHRTLTHPHVQEQPFTRSLNGVEIPAGTISVFVQAHCLVDGWGAQLFEVVLDN